MNRTTAAPIICTLAALVAAPMLHAQELRQVGNRQCAIEGTALFAYLESQQPGCDLYCTVDRESVGGYEDYTGVVFACVDRRQVVVVVNQDPSGLAAAGIGAVAGLGLLLGLASGGTGGSTSDTQ